MKKQRLKPQDVAEEADDEPDHTASNEKARGRQVLALIHEIGHDQSVSGEDQCKQQRGDRKQFVFRDFIVN
jgi:hypothetical protein